MNTPETTSNTIKGHFESRLLTTIGPDGKEKVREILMPDDEARAAHHYMLQFFYDQHYIHDWELRESTFVAGGMPGSKLIDNVLPHANGQKFYQLDLKNAFPSVNIDMLKTKLDPFSMVQMRWYINEALNDLNPDPKPEQSPEQSSITKLIWKFIDTYATAPGVPGLPLGAPCSPYLFNFYLQEMDRELDEYLGRHGLTYTRWLDDITISSTQVEGILGERMRRKINKIIEETSDMSINHAKSKVRTRQGAPVTVTGVDLHSDGRIQPRRQLMRASGQAFREAETYFETRGWNFDEANEQDRHMLGTVNGYRGTLLSMTGGAPGNEVRGALRHSAQIVSLVRGVLSRPEVFNGDTFWLTEEKPKRWKKL